MVVISTVTMHVNDHSVPKETAGDQWDVEKLILAARNVKHRASVPLSRFRVGAAVLTKSGRIFEGCNTECLIPVLGVCAERNAINHALIHGENNFLAVAVVSDLHAALLPCGTCLQYIQEFARQKRRGHSHYCGRVFWGQNYHQSGRTLQRRIPTRDLCKGYSGVL